MIKNKSRYKIFILIAFAMALMACERVVVVVDKVPPNTPAGQPLYITGNFNNWDPGDQRFQMKLNQDSSYSIELPPGFGTIEYKFTRGDWTTVEKDVCGYEIGNHSFVLGEADTVVNAIDSWNDLDPVNCPRVTIILDSVPGDTPPDQPITVAGNFNSWNPEEAIMNKDKKGKYSITIDRPPNISKLEFKITRGDLSASEADEFGNNIPNREIDFGVKDTFQFKVEGWTDKPTEKSQRVVFIIRHLPKNTPPGANLYLVSSLNGWDPYDKNYIFQKNLNGQYFFPMLRKKKQIEYKITRGGWNTVETDRFGYDIPNRQTDLFTADTIYIEIQAWKDLGPERKDFELTVVITKLPETTPPDARIYMTGNFNGWDPRRNRNEFHKDPQGRYVVDIPRERQDIEFKVTRGSWETLEVDKYGSDIQNRVVTMKDFDTVYIQVQNWKDLPVENLKQVTLVIRSMPEDTPTSDKLYFTPDYNGWDPGDPNMIFKTLPDGKPYITIPSRKGSTEYKITRGNWDKVEVDQYGNNMANRVLNYGFADTVYIDVIAWRDFKGNY